MYRLCRVYHYIDYISNLSILFKLGYCNITGDMRLTGPAGPRRVDVILRQWLNGSFRVEPQHESVRGGLNDLLPEKEVREALDLTQQRHVAALPQLEGYAWLDVAVQRALGNKRPVLHLADLAVVLQYGGGDQVLLQEGPGRQVVGEAGGEVLQDGLHRVPRLLPGRPQVLLQ